MRIAKMILAAKVPITGRGGRIYVSPDITQENPTIWERTKAWGRSRWQRGLRTTIVTDTMLARMKESRVNTGWSTSPLFASAYRHEPSGITHQEKAFFIEVFFMPYPVLKQLAEDLRKAFHQKQVLLLSYDTGEAEFIPP
jgi:hypothetical protein